MPASSRAGGNQGRRITASRAPALAADQARRDGECRVRPLLCSARTRCNKNRNPGRAGDHPFGRREGSSAGAKNCGQQCDRKSSHACSGNPGLDDSIVTEPSRRDMGVRHGTSAAQSRLTPRRRSPAFAVFAIALAVFLSSVAVVLTGSGGAFPWLLVAALAAAPILLGVVSALLTIWRTEEREPYYLR